MKSAPMRFVMLCLLSLSSQAFAELSFQSRSITTSAHAAQPSVAVDPGAGFVLTWQERGSPNRLLFAVLDQNGLEQRRGQIAEGEDWFINGADFPSLVVLDNGDWLSFWLQKTSPGTYAYAIHSVRSRDAGLNWDPPVVVHTDGTDTEHGFVSMVPAGADRVRLLWLDGRRMAGAGHDHEGEGEHMTVRTASLGRDRILREQKELDELSCSCCQTDAVRSDSGVLFAYRDRSEAEIRDISVIRHSANGWSKPLRVFADDWTIAGCPVNGPALAASGGQFAVLWPTMAGGEMRIRFARGDGSTFSEPVTLAEGVSETGRVDLVGWGDGGYLATRLRQTSAGPELQIDQIDGASNAQPVHTIRGKIGGFPRIARLDGSALLAWTEAGAEQGSSRLGLMLVAGE